MGEVSSHSEDGWMKSWEPWGALGSCGGCMWGMSRNHRAMVWPQEHLHQEPGMSFDFWLSPSVRKGPAILGWEIAWATLSPELLCHLLTLLCILGDLLSG